MNGKIIKLLEEKINVKFEGETGNDLLEFIKNKCLNLLENYNSPLELTCGDFANPEEYYLSMEAKCASVLDEVIKYDDLVPMDEKEYKCVKDMVDSNDEMPMVKGYITELSKQKNFFEMVDCIKAICKENNTEALLEFVSPLDETDISVSFDGSVVKYIGTIKIDLTTSETLLQSLLWIAYRVKDRDLDDYLSLFELEIIE